LDYPLALTVIEFWLTLEIMGVMPIFTTNGVMKVSLDLSVLSFLIWNFLFFLVLIVVCGIGID